MINLEMCRKQGQLVIYVYFVMGDWEITKLR